MLQCHSSWATALSYGLQKSQEHVSGLQACFTSCGAHGRFQILFLCCIAAGVRKSTPPALGFLHSCPVMLRSTGHTSPAKDRRLVGSHQLVLIRGLSAIMYMSTSSNSKSDTFSLQADCCTAWAAIVGDALHALFCDQLLLRGVMGSLW